MRRGPARVAVKIGEMGPAGNLDRLENARLDERLDRLSRVVRAETEIIAQVLRRGDAERLSRALDEGALRILLVRSRQSEDLGRNDALGQIVDPLEAAAPRRRCDVARPEQPFERLFGVAPFPPARPAAFFLEVRGGAGTLVADALEKAFRLGAALAREHPQALPTGLAAIRAGHPPTQQGMQRQRQERRLMGPVFEQPPLLPCLPRRPSSISERS